MREDTLRRVGRLLDVPYRRIARELEARKTDLLTPVTIKTDVPDAKVNYLLEHQNEFPGVQISQDTLRHFDDGALAAQALGYVSEISPEQLERTREGRLRRRRPDRAIGRRGAPTTCTSVAAPVSAGSTSTRSAA